jgi:hypothetical protein
VKRSIPLALAAACLLGPAAGADPLDTGLSDSRSQATRAALPGLDWLGVFAEGRSYRVARDGAGLDLSGGAYLELLHNLSLRGGYRIFDYDGSEGDSSWESDQHGLLLGVALTF